MNPGNYLTLLKMIFKYPLSLLSSFAFLICLPPTLADTLLVPSQYTTIQDGIDAAVNGDTVLVAPGTYTGVGNRDIELLGKSIVVMSEAGPDMTILDCETNSNRGFYVHQGEDATTEIIGFRIINASEGIRCNDDPIVYNCILENCTKGIYLNSSEAQIRNCVSKNNGPSNGAGITVWPSPNAVVSNCLFEGNSSSSNGAGYFEVSGDSPLFINCTFTNNTANSQGGGIYMQDPDKLLKMRNCIVWENMAGSDPNIRASYYSVTYSDIEEICILGLGNVSVDPQFSDSLFHLSSTSPLIDAGSPGDEYGFEPLPHGGRINMGAYGNTSEATTSLTSKPVISSIMPDSGLPAGGETDTILGRQFGTLTGQVYFGDSAALTTLWSDTMIICITPSHPSGKIAVQVFDNANQFDSLTFGYTYLGPAVLCVPSEYLTIQAAINCAADGDTILVAPGTYSGFGNRDIELLGKSIVVMSESGPEMTVIDCETKTNRGFYVHQGEDATTEIIGFRIINASEGIRCNDDPKVYNCILENCTRGLYLDGSEAQVLKTVSRSNGPSNGAGITVWPSPNAVVSNCLFEGNSSSSNGAGYFEVGGDSPLFVNCTFAGNSSAGQGGGIYMQNLSGVLKMRNCIVSENTGSSNPNIRTSLYDITYTNVEDSVYAGIGNISDNPSFVNTSNSDYHLLSISTSIDAGDPGDDYGNEPMPNGGRINMGAYGNTSEATSFAAQTTIDSFRYAPTCQPNVLLTIYGIYFENTQQTGSIAINDQNIPIISWTDIMIVADVPSNLIGDYNIIVSSHSFGSDTISANLLFTPGIIYVSGEVSGTWTTDCPGMYVMTDDVTIPTGDTLIIEPGVKVLANIDSSTNISFTVNGTLIAQGTEQDSIVFSVFQDQKSPGNWSGITVYNDQINMQYCIVEFANTGIVIQGSDAYISRCRISNSIGNGVEFYARNEDISGILDNSLIQGNQEWGVLCRALTTGISTTTSPILQNNTIRWNEFGGIYVLGHASTPNSGIRRSSGNSRPKIIHNLMYGNSGYSIKCLGSGDYRNTSPFDLEYIGRASPHVEGNIIRDNEFGVQTLTSPGGPNDWLSYAEPIVVNNTFWNNGLIDLYAGDSTTITVINSIFWDDMPSSIQTEGNGKVLISYSNFDSLYAGDGNISGNPLYIDPNNGDFRINKASPSIDAGNNDFVTDTIDYYGNIRIIDGDFDDSLQVDMGAFESDGSCLAVAEIIWTAIVNVWNIPVNWNLGYIPTICSDIDIPNGQVTIQNGETGQGRSIEVQIGASLHVDLGAKLEIDP